VADGPIRRGVRPGVFVPRVVRTATVKSGRPGHCPSKGHQPVAQVLKSYICVVNNQPYATMLVQRDGVRAAPAGLRSDAHCDNNVGNRACANDIVWRRRHPNLKTCRFAPKTATSRRGWLALLRHSNC
jgi:hypothetical protein